MTSPDYTHAVSYSPSTTAPAPPTLPSLQSSGVHSIRIQWLDLTSKLRYRVLPITYFAKLLTATTRPSISIAKVTLGIVGITTAEGFSAQGEYVYIVDWSTVRICGYAEGHASVMGWFEEKVPMPGRMDVGVELCPRATLRRIVESVLVSLIIYIQQLIPISQRRQTEIQCLLPRRI
jgi:hypothetical protein